MVVNTINTNTSSISNMAMFSRQPPISVYIAERLSLAKFDSSRHMMERCDPRNSKVDWGGSPSSLVWTEVSNLDWLETSGSYKYSLIFKFLWESSRKPGNLRSFCLLLLSRLWLLLAHECSLPSDWDNPAFSLHVSQMSLMKRLRTD